MKVLKFGGTSVGSADRIRAVAGLIDNGEPQIVVLSAMSGVYPENKLLVHLLKAVGQALLTFR